MVDHSCDNCVQEAGDDHIDINKILNELRAEREEIEKTIIALERLRGKRRGRPPQWMKVMEKGAKAGSTQATATLPVVIGWFNGQAALYISPEASTAAAAGPDGNVSILLAASANTSAAPSIYFVTNFKQGNIIPVAPLSTGPTNVSTTYSPLWQVVTVTWNSGVAPTLLTSSQDVQAAMSSGMVTLNKTNIIVNCPVIYTPLGGALPGVTISTQSNQG